MFQFPLDMPSYEDLSPENAELRRRVAEQERQIASLKRQIEDLKKQVEELRRRGKRQAAPFSKGEPSEDPKSPGRKAGDQYGQQATRSRPEQVDETIEVECPLYCEHCQGKVVLTGKAPQYQVDLPEIRPRTTEFILHYGKCSKCGREAVGRHPRQTSQAFRVGSVQLGPSVVAFAAWLNKVGGLSYGKIVGYNKEILDYVVVEDGGVLVNPMIVDGQIIGGTAQGIGTALYEEMRFDAQGQPQASTLSDYLLPGACEVPDVRIVHMETPSPYTRFGQKGLGEGGAIAPPAAITNAVNDALAGLGAELLVSPITPRRIVEALTAARQAAAA
jgi:DNA-directed RNA polymerase subunit RPC12/RpoP